MKPTDMHVIISRFLHFINQIKIYHWSTYSYSRHKASDKLFEAMIESSDTFVETSFGILRGSNRKTMLTPSIRLPPIRPLNDKNIIEYLLRFSDFLLGDLGRMIQGQPDLLNIRDSILADVRQTLYRFTLV